HFRDAGHWLANAPVDDETLPLEVRAGALGAAGAIAFYTHDDVDAAERFWQEGLELRRVQDDPLELGAAFSWLASVAWRRGDVDGAIAYHKQALPLYEQAGADALFLTELHWLGESYRDPGDYDKGERGLDGT